MIESLAPLIPFATTFATSAGSQIIKLLGKKIQTELTELNSELQHAFFNSFSKYIGEVYERNSFFASIVFSNQQKRLKDYYVPLTLLKSGKESEKIIVNTYPGSFIVEKKDLLIVDTAGMGKSTLLKYLFLSCIEVNAGIPIFIELRKLSKNKSLLNYITEQLKDLNGKIDSKLIFKLLESGQFIFFLDGYDEIPDEDREAVTQDIVELKRRINKNIFILSSRQHRGLSTFTDFYKSTIKPLDFNEASELIKKYSHNEELGHSLIIKLGKPENKPIHEFLNNPLLVSLLFKAYEFKHTIPLKKHSFYRQVYEALFENHDLSKELGGFERRRECGLDMYSFELLLRALGFESLQTTKIEYEKDELLQLLEKCRKHVPTLNFNPQFFINDLIYKVPLFIRDGTQIRWSHKSLQEYFAALFVSTGGPELQSEVLLNMYESKKIVDYVNFLSLFAEIEPKNFRHILIKAILVDFKTESNIWNKFNDKFAFDQIELRKGLTCFRDFVFASISLEDFKESDAKAMAGKSDSNHSLGIGHRSQMVYESVYPNSFINYSYSVGRKTVVSFKNPKWDLITQLIQANILQELDLKLNSPKINSPISTEVNFPYKEDMIVLLTDSKDNLLNTSQLFSITNKYLSSWVDVLIFDSKTLSELLKKINREIGNNSTKKYNF